MNGITPQQAAREALRRKKAHVSLAAFREYMQDSLYLDFLNEPAHHHRVMIHQLERLERGEIKRLLILAPPGSAKSTYCSIQYPLFRLANQPNQNILCASNTQDLASAFNRRRRNAALSPQWMTLSGTKLAEDLQGAEHFGTERQGSIKAAGVGSAIAGNRSHLNILDDPIRGVEEAMSSTTLDKQWDWFNSEFRTRLVPTGQEVIVSTRWAKKDIAGRILERVKAGEEDWTVLRLPMIADRLDDPLGRAMGDALWPEHFTSQHIAEFMRNPLLWSTQFQQTPLDESGSWIAMDHLIFEDLPGRETELNYVIAMDLALSVGAGDFTVIVVAGIDSFRRVHILHVDRKRTSPEDTVGRLVQLCEIYKPTEVLMDDDNSSKVFKTLLHEVYRNERFPIPPLHSMPLQGRNKETRAAAIRGAFMAGNVRIAKANWNNDFMRECLEFPSGDHDDIIDCLSLIGRRLPNISAPDAPRSAVPVNNANDLLIINKNEGLKLNMTIEALFNERSASARYRRDRI